jgi:hypothetical protein
MRKNNAYIKSSDWKCFDIDALSNDIIDFSVRLSRRLAKQINPFPLIPLLFIMSSAQVAAQSLEDSNLNNQSLYASGYITAGARTTVGGNAQRSTAVT